MKEVGENWAVKEKQKDSLHWVTSGDYGMVDGTQYVWMQRQQTC
jgi:hypothetical protein